MKDGLEGVVAVRTVLSDVDGQAGRLVLRGHRLEEIADWAAFEDVVSLLWSGIVDEPGIDATDPAEIRSSLGRARVRAFEKLPALLPLADGLSVVEALRLGLASFGDDTSTSPSIDMTAAMAVFTAAFSRHLSGREILAPDPSTSHASDFLRMLHGKPASEQETRALDTYLVTAADHGLNASTFTARVVASTDAGVIFSVVAGLSALKGPLHGGAPGPVLDMLDDIGCAEHAAGWITDALDRGERLMGFGHRVYKVRDPRADVLKGAVADLKSAVNRIPLAEAVEQQVLEYLRQYKPGRKLDTNVEFYTALLLEAVGIPRDCFTPVFGCARVAGWVAHIHEQVATGRLMRPSSEYIGPEPDAAAA